MALPDYPISRNEKYLSAIAGQETELPDYPITREEQYLAYIAEHGGGGGNVPDPTVDDIGKVVGAVADGSSAKLAYVEGGSGLPPVTGSGKALVSVDGEWVEQDGYPYEEEGGETVIVDNETVETTEASAGVAMGYFSESFELVAGNSYNVIFNGAEYNALTAADSSGAILLSDGDPSTGVFTFIIYTGLTPTPMLALTSAGNYTVTIKEVTSTVHTIDPKYIPEFDFKFTINVTGESEYELSVPYEDIVEALQSGKKVYCFVEDEGLPRFDFFYQEEGFRALYFGQLETGDTMLLYKIRSSGSPRIELLQRQHPTTDDVQNMIDTAIGDAVGGAY